MQVKQKRGNVPGLSCPPDGALERVAGAILTNNMPTTCNTRRRATRLNTPALPGPSSYCK